ncbi:MAG: hypothetical protein JSR63_03155 [Proteobacteria bacterium]|nr:hypothetical protein [Pseudomonadota bacterium]MBS0217161.1 hypothetical protein [Pseudomonadota bacterium]
MKATFTKGNGKYDKLIVERSDGSVESLDCPKQRIIPHDMVHFAVESTLSKRGFMARVKAGEPANFTMQGDPESDGVERLVEVFQGDAWSGGATPFPEMLDLYLVTCQERACSPFDLSIEDMQAIRATVEDLDRQWDQVPIGGSLSVIL